MAHRNQRETGELPSAADKEPRSQSQKFIDAARKAEADEDETAFEERLKQIAKAKRKKEKAPDK